MSETVPSVPSEAFVLTAAVAIHGQFADGKCSHDALGDDCWYLARAALVAAFPLIEAAVAKATAEKIADAVEAMPLRFSRTRAVMDDRHATRMEAAGIARSFAGATRGDADERA